MSRLPSPPIEVLYSDKRIDLYYDQMASGVTYDQTTKWTLGLKLTGPEVGVGTEQHGRSVTSFERLQELIARLEEADLIMDGRPIDQNRWRPESRQKLRYEQCSATRVQVPAQGNAVRDLAIWIALAEETTSPAGRELPGSLFLIEDKPTYGVSEGGMSGASALQLLVIATGDFVESVREAYTTPSMLEERFTRDPIGLLRSAGGVIGMPRRIGCIYRVRFTCNDLNSEPSGRVATVAYPLIIWEADE